MGVFGDIEGHRWYFWGREVTGGMQVAPGRHWWPWDTWVTPEDVEDIEGTQVAPGDAGGLA